MTDIRPLHRRAKLRAVQDDMDMNELVVAALERYLAKDDAP